VIAPPSMLRRLAGPLLLVLLLAWTAIVHHGLGPRPDLGAQWYSPTGFLTRALLASPFEWLVSERWKGFLAFWTPAVLLTLGCWLTSRSALIRATAVGATLACALFILYALGSEMSRVAWTLFHWRASGTMLAIAGVVAATLVAPWLAASWLRLPWALRIATFLPVALAVVGIERGVTGTNPRLPFAISPWPAVQVFALEVIGTIVASLLAGAALGLVGLAMLRRGRTLAGAAFVAIGLALPAAWLALGSQGFLPFRAGARGFAIATVLGALALSVAALPRLEPGRLGRRARVLGTAALLLGLPLLVGQAWARLDYARNRDVHAQRVIDALASHYERERIYPETLQALVTSKDLDELPKPSVGFGFLGDGASFTYQGFGTSYLLEFPAPRWVQCAYNPPYDDEEFDDEDEPATDAAADGDEDMGGSWSCPSSPPELW
jgi:hypothetical protein